MAMHPGLLLAGRFGAQPRTAHAQVVRKNAWLLRTKPSRAELLPSSRSPRGLLRGRVVWWRALGRRAGSNAICPCTMFDPPQRP
jgi:hypothetical protein